MIELRCGYCGRVLMEIEPGQDTTLKVYCRRCRAHIQWVSDQPDTVTVLKPGRPECVPPHRPGPSQYK